jgi:RNA polymerase sigma-70 factor (ECF subfamily)
MADHDTRVQALITAGQRLLGEGQAEAAKAQFEAAIDLVYRHYQDAVYRLCLSRLGDAGWAEEISHEVLIAAYLALPTFRREAAVRTWLSGICHLKITQARRNVWRRSKLFKEQQKAIRDGAHPVDQADANLLGVLRKYGVDKLRKRDQLLFVKRYIEGYTLAELTTPWLSEAAVRQRLAKIVQWLQRQTTHGE